MNDADHALKEIAAEEIDEVDIIMEDITDEIADLQQSITNSSMSVEIETDGDGSQITQVPCSINKKQINCNQSVYTDKIAWRTSRAYVNEQIRRLRSQLGELKEIRSHLKAKRPNVYIEYPAEIDMADLDGDLLQIEDDLARTLQRKTMTTSAEKNQRHCNCKSKRYDLKIRDIFVIL